MATTSNAATNWLEENVLNHFFGVMSTSAPTSLEVALFPADPGEDGTGATELNNTDEPGYARISLTNLSSDLTVASDGDGYAVSNAATLEYEADGGNWTNAPSHFGIYDVDNAQWLAYGAIDDGASALSALTDGQKLQITAGNLKVKVS